MTFQNNKIAEVKVCNHCQNKFEITLKDFEFYEKVSPVFAWIIYQIPTPKLCPDCRQQRRMSFRNERKLYKRKCNATGENIISIYSPDKPYKVYNQNFRWSDKWDAMDYWIDFDFTKSFSKQFKNLIESVPHISLSIVNSENSDYNNDLLYSKNAYLCIDAANLDNSSYITWCKKISNSLDIWWCEQIENSYEIISSDNIYNSFYCYRVYYMKNSMFCKECYNCEDCIMCYWLKNKKYCIENTEYSKKEYEEKKKNYLNWSHKNISELKKYFIEFCKKFPQRNVYAYNSTNYTWSNIYNSSECYDCFDVAWLNKWKYSFDSGWNTSNVMDWSFVYEWDWLILDSINILNSMKVAFSVNITNSNYVYYSYYLFWCSNCFWCVWLKSKSYCIFNKQYTKEQYEELVPKIIEQMQKAWDWWVLFNPIISLFGYNETMANDWFNLDKSSAINQWFNWSLYESPFPKVDKFIPASKLPDNISDIPDDILNRAVECEITKKPFKIIKQELEFYRKYNLPIPRRHPEQRHLDRMNLRNPRILYDRKCAKCSKDIKTTFAPERSEIIYCEDCFNKEFN